MPPVLRVLNPGLSTTIQDLGRRSCLEFGIPLGGAADMYSHRLANAVVGNGPSAATLEMMLLGGRFEVMAPLVVAVAGAEMGFQLNGEEAPAGCPIEVAEGDVLSFAKARRGCFGYLAAAGGFRGAVAFGSRSTYVAGRLGGHFGRALHRGDVVHAAGDHAGAGFNAGQNLLEWPLRQARLRFVRGPQPEYFTEAAYAAFTREPFTVSPRSNRVAYRLTGPAPEIVPLPRTADTGSGPTDIIEDGNAVGAIQVAGGVEPICMGRDCPSSGAYAKIGCIITPDVSRMAQMQPGDSFIFEEVSVEVACVAAREAETTVRAFAQLASNR